MKLLKDYGVSGMRFVSILALFAGIIFSAPIHAFQTGQRIMAVNGGVYVRNVALTSVLFTQNGGVYGTLVAVQNGSAGGFTGNWWQINWDPEPPNQNGVKAGVPNL